MSADGTFSTKLNFWLRKLMMQTDLDSGKCRLLSLHAIIVHEHLGSVSNVQTIYKGMEYFYTATAVKVCFPKNSFLMEKNRKLGKVMVIANLSMKRM